MFKHSTIKSNDKAIFLILDFNVKSLTLNFSLTTYSHVGKIWIHTLKKISLPKRNLVEIILKLA